jgi:hypothetical protein
MSHTDRTDNNVEAFFHPVSHYESPDDVLNDARLSTNEKRVILSSWASDMYVVESDLSRNTRYPAQTMSGRDPGGAEAA